ncbi:hypothetical protein [Stagnihabitans tardus]|uniref:Tetratricopeptide repeat-like domain-containing protein n=1 Tax=Stagnihabitans tardus TaxID=2699202 RepID=A0AAE5BVA4_9RHOB|nr:hypothetical protein [Stagnihabitans tardus]NBZ87589.1 hypothetical protein [Stagnihabitans tardus]
MSSQDSFVDEVTEAVRRDKLYATFRKWGWVGGVIVIGIVGGAAWSEWQKAKEATRAQGFGDAVQAALEIQDPAARATALAAIPADGGQKAVLDLLKAADPEGNKQGALAALEALSNDATQPQLYRDLAVIKRVSLAGADMALADRRAALTALVVPGRPMRTLAEEALAYLLLEEGKTPEALEAMLALHQDQEAPLGMKQRLEQVIVALGGTVPEKIAPEGVMPQAG